MSLNGDGDALAVMVAVAVAVAVAARPASPIYLFLPLNSPAMSLRT